MPFGIDDRPVTPGNGPDSSKGETCVKWPIDTSVLSFMGSLPPEPVLDRQTWRQEISVNGDLLYSVELMCFWENGAELLSVRFPGTPPVGLDKGVPVKVTNLFVSDYPLDAGHGLTFEADRVAPLSVAGPEGGAA
jgi:hypothetical protein